MKTNKTQDELDLLFDSFIDACTVPDEDFQIRKLIQSKYDKGLLYPDLIIHTTRKTFDPTEYPGIKDASIFVMESNITIDPSKNTDVSVEMMLTVRDAAQNILVTKSKNSYNSGKIHDYTLVLKEFVHHYIKEISFNDRELISLQLVEEKVLAELHTYIQIMNNNEYLIHSFQNGEREESVYISAKHFNHYYKKYEENYLSMQDLLNTSFYHKNYITGEYTNGFEDTVNLSTIKYTTTKPYKRLNTIINIILTLNDNNN